MKKLLFIFLSAVAFAGTVAFAGLMAHWLPSPTEFIATLIIAIPLGWLAVRLSGYREWPVVILFLLLLLIGLPTSLVTKRLIFAATASSAVDIPVKQAGEMRIKDFYSFTDSRIDFERSGYYLLQHYGDHHYYAFPVLGEDWAEGDEVAVWAWARTQKSKDISQQKRLLPVSTDFGLRVRTHAIKINVQKSIEVAADTHQLNIPEKVIVLNWGEGKSTKLLWQKVTFRFYIFMSLIILSVLIQMLFRLRKSASSVVSSEMK